MENKLLLILLVLNALEVLGEVVLNGNLALMSIVTFLILTYVIDNNGRNSKQKRGSA